MQLHTLLTMAMGVMLVVVVDATLSRTASMTVEVKVLSALAPTTAMAAVTEARINLRDE